MIDEIKCIEDWNVKVGIKKENRKKSWGNSAIVTVTKEAIDF